MSSYSVTLTLMAIFFACLLPRSSPLVSRWHAKCPQACELRLRGHQGSDHDSSDRNTVEPRRNAGGELSSDSVAVSQHARKKLSDAVCRLSLAWSSALLFAPLNVGALEGLQVDSLPKSSLLVKRVNSGDVNRYQPGITSPDVYYPDWLEGKWLVRSSGLSVNAPLGVAAFGGAQAMEAAQRDGNTTIEYKSIFRAIDGKVVVADRLYNVEQIVEATMGSSSIDNDSQRGTSADLAKRLRLVISPPAANGIQFVVDLLTTDRVQETPSDDLFCALEKSTQTIQRRGGGVDRPPMIKEIETITIYQRLSASRVVGLQRTATFLSPIDPRFEAISSSQPRMVFTAVDVRQYSLTYDKVPSL